MSTQPRTVPLYDTPCPDCGQRARDMVLLDTHTTIRHTSSHLPLCRAALHAGQAPPIHATGGAQ